MDESVSDKILFNQPVFHSQLVMMNWVWSPQVLPGIISCRISGWTPYLMASQQYESSKYLLSVCLYVFLPGVYLVNTD